MSDEAAVYRYSTEEETFNPNFLLEKVDI